MVNVKQINKSLENDLLRLEEELQKGGELSSKIRSKFKSLEYSEGAALMALDYLHNKEDYNHLPKELKRYLDKLTSTQSEKSLLSKLPSQKKVAFLSDLEYMRPKSQEELKKLKHHHKLSDKDYRDLEQSKAISKLNRKESILLETIVKNSLTEHKDILFVSREIGYSPRELDLLRNKKHIDYIKGNERAFLSKINGKKYHIDSIEIIDLRERLSIKPSEMQRMKENGKLNGLSARECRDLESILIRAKNDITIVEENLDIFLKKSILPKNKDEYLKRIYRSTDGTLRVDNALRVEFRTNEPVLVKSRYRESLQVSKLRIKDDIPYKMSIDSGDFKRMYKYKNEIPQSDRADVRSKYLFEANLANLNNALLPQDKADLLAIIKKPSLSEHIPHDRLSYLKFLRDDLKINIELKETKEVNNKDYFTLANLRRKNVQIDKVDKFLSEYKLTKEALDKWKERELIDYPSSEDLDIVTSLTKKDISKTDADALSVRQKGFASFMTEDEAKYLFVYEGKDIRFEELLEGELVAFSKFSPSLLNNLKRNEIIDVLSRNELEWLENGANASELGNYNLTAFDEGRLKKRLTEVDKWDIIGHDSRGLSLPEKNYLYDLKIKNDYENRFELGKDYGISEARLKKLDALIKTRSLKEIVIDKTLKLGADEVIPNNRIRVKYKELSPLLEERIKAPVGISSKREYTDLLISLKAEYQGVDVLKQHERDRYFEIVGNNIPVNTLILPNRNELNFFEHIRGRELKKFTHLYQIALKDFGINDQSIKYFIENNIISVRKTKNKKKKHVHRVSVRWSEFKELENARIEHATFRRLDDIESNSILKTIGLPQTDDRLFRLIANSEASFEKKNNITPLPNVTFNITIKTEDIPLFFKIRRSETLSKYETKRLNYLRGNGVHPESMEVTNFLLGYDKKQEWKGLLKRERVKHFLTKENIDPFVFDFVNTFRKVSRSQLNRLGLKDVAIDSYVNGINSEDPLNNGVTLLQQKWVETEQGRLEFFTISGGGKVTARSILRQRLDEKKIKNIQKFRGGLVHHDLEVVTSVQKVIDLYEKEGYIVTKINSEEVLMSDSKSGKDNNKRQTKETFMDAEIHFVPRHLAYSKNLEEIKPLVVAVEYGNYTKARMEKKLNNCNYDKAYVFSNEAHYKSYTTKIASRSNVVYSVQ